MKTKARGSTEISLPGRFLVFVPQGEGLGVSRRLDDAERTRLKEIIKEPSTSRTAASSSAPPPRAPRPRTSSATSSSCSGSGRRSRRARRPRRRRRSSTRRPSCRCESSATSSRRLRERPDRPRAHVQADRRLPEEDVAAHARARAPLQGEDAALRGHGRRRRDPLDAEPPRRPALGRLPHLRLRRGLHGRRRQHRPLRRLALEELDRPARGHDHEEQPRGGEGGRAPAAAPHDGGIIVIDFIDMANPKNRATVEEALRTELERDRTKTYVVEISRSASSR